MYWTTMIDDHRFGDEFKNIFDLYGCSDSQPAGTSQTVAMGADLSAAEPHFLEETEQALFRVFPSRQLEPYLVSRRNPWRDRLLKLLRPSTEKC